MTNLTATPGLDNVPQIETNTVLLGGAGAPMNAQAQALLNRTEFLSQSSQFLAAAKWPGVDSTGVADSTAGLIAAHATGRNIFYHNGTYKISGKIPISIYARIIGESSAGVVINNSNDSVFAFEHLSVVGGPYDIDSGLEITGLTINSKNCIRLNQSGNYATVFSPQGSIKRVKIHNNNLTGKYDNGIVDPDKDTNVPVTDATLRAFGVGISCAKVVDSEITLNKIEHFGVAIGFDGCDINTVRLNRLNKNGRHFYHYGHDTWGGQTKFKENDCLYNHRVGGAYLFNTIFNTISDNYFEGYSNSSTFIKTESDTGTLICANRFDDPGLSIPFMSLAPYYGAIITQNRYTGPAVAYAEMLGTYYDANKKGFGKCYGNQAGFPEINFPLCLKTPDIDGSSFRYNNCLPFGGSAAAALPFVISPSTGRYALRTSVSNADIVLQLMDGKKFYNIKYAGRYVAGGGYHVVSHVAPNGTVTAINAGSYIGFPASGDLMTITETIAIPDALVLSGTLKITIVNTEVEIERIDIEPATTLYLDAAPTGATTTYKVGQRVQKMTPAVGSPKGWVCTVSGSPGTWVSEGNL